MNDRKYWLGFSLIPEIGPKRLLRLRNWFHDLESAWTASESALYEAGLGQHATRNLLALRARLNLPAEIEKLERIGARFITLDETEYPGLLKQLPDAPIVLYVRGTLLPDDERALAVVGTRRASTYGRDVAHHLSRELAANEVTVVSGLAHGIDAAAHQGALDGGGRTIAVLGCGIDRIYPSDHQTLAARIVQHGALVSEFPLGSAPDARHFPRRNRIISGLAVGVLIVEAPVRSGALITATAAAEQGRDVFAVPGSVFSATSAGPHQLIQEGAKLVMKVEDILDELNLIRRQVETRAVAEKVAPATENERLILDALGTEPIHVDDLGRRCGLPVAVISSTLTILELKGLARIVGPMQYCLAQDW